MEKSPRSILFIDDNPNDRALAARSILSQFPGCEAKMAENRMDAFERILDLGDFDGVITDYQIRWITGLEVLKRVKARYPYCPVVMFTNTGNEEVAAEGLRSGLDDYVTKSPAHYSRLGIAMRGALERCAFHSERDSLLLELQMVREQLEEANCIKDDFLAMISHELRTPLNAILGWASLVKGNLSDRGKIGEGLSVIERNARTQAQLIDDLLEVSRIVGGAIRIEMEPVSLPPVIDSALAAVADLASTKRVHFETAVDATVGLVGGDPRRLQQILLNLLHNAVKFSDRRGTVRITLEQEGLNAKIAIADEGIGIDPEFLPHLFTRFRQADTSVTNRRYGGLGLGLSLVRDLVALHHGEIHARSEGVGRGTTFIVSFPLLQNHDRREERKTRDHSNSRTDSSLPSLSGVRILTVEHDKDTLELLQALLSGQGAEVVVAETVEQALARIAEQRPHLLISEMGMADSEGLELIKRIRLEEGGDGGRLPAIALTAYASPDDRREAILSGFHVHISKPFDISELVATVANLTQPAPETR